MQTEPQHSMQKQSKSSDRIKKGKKKGPIIFIIVFILLAALATAFIIFILPKLSKGEPKGEYVNNDFAGHILFDDGVYAVYDSNGGYELGTYEVKGDKITFTDANGDIDYGKYNKKDNTVEYGYLFELNDSKETFDIDIDKKYVKVLKEKISDAATEVCADDEILAEAEMLNGSYYICDTELADKNTAFTSALSDKLGYGSDKILSYLIENKFIAIDISVNISSKTADVTIY